MTLRRALVLTAGLGTRLRPLTLVRAKAAVPVNGEPLVRRILRWLAGHGIRDAVLNLHHRPETITACVGDGGDLGVRVRYSWEQPVLGSAGGPRHALPLLVEEAERNRGPAFLLVNGDTLTDVNVAALIAAHSEANASVTMAVIPNPRPDKYGGVRVDADGRVLGFTRRGTPGESFHFIGVQVVEPAVFADLPDGTPLESVGWLYPRLMAERPGAVAAFVSGARFQDIGTPHDYLRTSLELSALEGDRLTSAVRTRIADSARLVRTALWDDVAIGPGAALTECIVADRVRVPEGARYERCAIVPAASGDPEPGERIEGDLLIKPL